MPQTKVVGYAVLLDKPEQLTPGPLARALAKMKGIPIQDAALLARHSWGIIAEALDQESSKRAVAHLAKSGLSALAIPSALLEDLPSPQLLSSIQLGRERILVQLQSGGELWSAWPSITLIASAGFQRIRRAAPRAETDPERRDEDLPRNESELVFYLDVFTETPPRRLRLDAESFDYSCLKSSMSYGTLPNFRRLLLALTDKAPRALRSRGTETLLDHKPVSSMGYESLRDLERESRWLLTLRVLGRL